MMRRIATTIAVAGGHRRCRRGDGRGRARSCLLPPGYRHDQPILLPVARGLARPGGAAQCPGRQRGDQAGLPGSALYGAASGQPGAQAGQARLPGRDHRHHDQRWHLQLPDRLAARPGRGVPVPAPGHVQLVTIDIGANDLNPCLSLPTLNQIMNTLATASGSGVPPIIGMTYYDPELAHWLKGTPADKALAKDRIALAQAFGNLLSGVYTSFGAKVADVFKAFHTAQFAARVTLPAFGKVPKAVGYICSYTWMCAAPPVGPNIHANRLGYAVIANTFLAVIFS